MNYILTYLLIGTLYTFLIELLADHLAKEYKLYDLKNELTLMVRVMSILIWPIGMIVFLNGYIKTRFKK
jgi:hypothetical protein